MTSQRPPHVVLGQTNCNQTRNRVLAALLANQWDPWHLHAELVDLQLDQILFESVAETAYVYFPVTAVVSLLYVMRDGESCEIAVVGNEGVVGLLPFMGGSAQSIQARVQSAGQGYRIRASIVQDEICRASTVLEIVRPFADATNAQVAQTAVCNRYHSIDQQLCRRLLLGMDRMQSHELIMSHQSAASLLGVRRESVTIAALRLQDSGAIRYNRGRIVVLDRRQLEHRACECYGALKKVYERLPGETLDASQRHPPAYANKWSRARDPFPTRARKIGESLMPNLPPGPGSRAPALNR
jgi:CRP-like cAMP-binding protein